MTNKSEHKRKFKDTSVVHQMPMFLYAYEAKLTAEQALPE